MNVKRTIAIILILSIIVVAVFALSGCNITNDGSEDELKGIYGVTTMYYKSYEGKKYNVSGHYEYFLLVLNGDEGRTGKVIMKRDGDAEFSYDITYTPKFNSDGKTIWSITVNDFRLPEYEDETGAVRYSDPSQREFRFYPMHETFTFSLTLSQMGDDNRVKFNKNYFALHKIAKKTTAAKIKSAKEQQQRTREARSHEVDEERTFGTYGVNEMYYISKDGKKHNVSGEFEYFIVALNESDGKTGQVIMKRDGKEEEKYDVTFTMTYGEDSSGDIYVQYVKISGFRLPEYEETGAVTFGAPQDVTFVHDITKKVTLTYKDEAGNNVMTFERTYVNVSNISIEQTKSQQRQSQEARGQ